MQDLVQIILLAEPVSERQASEVLNPVPVNRVHIEPDHQRCEEPDEDQHRDDDHDSLAVLVHRAKGDVGQEGEREQQAAEEAKDVCNVVNPWQEAAEEEEEDDPRKVQESLHGLLEDLPALEKLHKKAG